MKAVVCIKTATGGAVDASDAFDRAGRVGAAVLNACDARAVEAALRIVEQAGQGEVVVVALAPAEMLGAVREALALGANRALMLSDPLLFGADLLATSQALAALLAREKADIYLTCPWSGDVDGTLLWTATGERLGLPALTQARQLQIQARRVIIQCQTESGDQVLETDLPCMVEVTETIHRPRYATLKGKAAARSKPVQLLKLADLALEPPRSGTQVLATRERPPRRTPVVLQDSGEAPARILEFLRGKGMVP